MSLRIRVIVAGCLAAAGAFAQTRRPQDDPRLPDKVIHVTVHAARNAGEFRRSAKPNTMSYYGGPVQTQAPGVNVYYIWYGDWSSNTATTLLPAAVTGLSKSPYFNINTTYYDKSGAFVNNLVNFNGSTTDAYSQGKNLKDSDVLAVVGSAITGGKLAADPDGVYFVLASPDVNETSGFCTQYCGWHTYATVSGVNIKYAFVGNPERCPNACEWQSASSPNNNPGADGMASLIAHELEEAVTDPDLNAWHDAQGNENADKCAWTYGATRAAPNGSLYNMVLNGYQFLIQQNWVNSGGGFCAMSH